MGISPGKPIPREEDDASSFTCEICIQPTLSSKKFNNTNFCKHPFCQDCIAKYIKVKIQDHTAKIECPEPSCQHHLDPLICRPMLSPTLFSTWCDLLCEDSLLGTEKSYCPNRNCLALVLNEYGGNVKKCKCPNCKQLFCFQCQTVWHAGYRCEESGQTRDRNDVLFGQLVEKKNWVRCPGCGHCVERLKGCTFIVCRCKTPFCYHCGRIVSNNGCGCSHSYGNMTQLRNPQRPQRSQHRQHLNIDPFIFVAVAFFVLFPVALYIILSKCIASSSD